MKNDTEEIGLIEIIKEVWKGRKIVAFITVIFAIIGVIIAMLSPFVYTSSTTFITSNSESGPSSSLGGVASLVGINLGGMSTGGEIPASMYPQIAESMGFKRALLKSTIDEDEEIKLMDFLIEEYGVVKSLNSINKTKSFVSESENTLFNMLNGIISISVNQKGGFVTISADMPESDFAAKTCINAREILQEIVISNKIKSAKQRLEFSEEQLRSKRVEFEQIQNKLSYFNDSNLNIVTSSVINERNKLEADFEIINAVMIELSKQVEQRKLQVSEDTPVFSVIKEASMPVIRSSPKRIQIVLIYSLIGLITSVLYRIIKRPLIDVMTEIKS